MVDHFFTISGQELKEYTKDVTSFQTISYVQSVLDFIYNPKPALFFISGLLHSGTTTICKQAISTLNNELLSKTVLFVTSQFLHPSFFEFIPKIKEFISRDYKIFFIDNISETKEYFYGLQYISNNFLQNNCIFIIVNTDTYFSSFLQFYSIKYELLDVNFISYKEYYNLSTKTKNFKFDDFIEYGRIINDENIFSSNFYFSSIYNTECFIRKAVSQNIIRTISENIENIKNTSFTPLYDEGYLECAISRIVHYINWEYLWSAILAYLRNTNHNFSNEFISELTHKIKSYTLFCESYPRIINDKEKNLLISAITKTGFFISVTSQNSSAITFLHPGIRYNDLINILANIIHYTDVFYKEIEIKSLKEFFYNFIYTTIIEELILQELIKNKKIKVSRVYLNNDSYIYIKERRKYLKYIHSEKIEDSTNLPNNTTILYDGESINSHFLNLETFLKGQTEI